NCSRPSRSLLLRCDRRGLSQKRAPNLRAAFPAYARTYRCRPGLALVDRTKPQPRLIRSPNEGAWSPEMNLEKISPGLEEALEGARQLAESRRQSHIHPQHLMYVLFKEDGELLWLADRLHVNVPRLLDTWSTGMNVIPFDLAPGRRPTASRSLHQLIEKAFL